MPRTQVVTILFCDLVASTERRARLGDDAFDDFTDLLMTALRAAISEHDGREVATAGDGIMVVFAESVVDAVACAIAMHPAVAALDRDDPPRLRIGISTGEVARDGDEFSGMPIVEAARLEASAAPGQTLANAIVRSLVGTRRALRFRDVGELTLKGIPMPLATVEVIDEEVVDEPSVETTRAVASVSARPDKARRRRVALATTAIALVVVLIVGLVVVRSRSGTSGIAGPTARHLTGVTGPKGYTPRYVPMKSCPDDVRTVAGDATCGHLIVPQDRSKPGGRPVTMLVTRAPARLDGPTIAPTIDVCGCENLGNSLARDHGELIHVGQRGYSGSSPVLTCPEFSDSRRHALTRPSDDPSAIASGTDALRRCYRRFVARGIDPAQYNFDAAARDVLDLMFVLEIRRANFVAFERSAAEVFDLLRRAPAAVRSITLDNPPPPGESVLTDPIGDLSGAFTRFVALCNGDPACAAGYPDLAAKWRSAYAAADAHPKLVAVASPEDADPSVWHVLIDGPRLADALRGALSSGDATVYKLIPAAITQTTTEAAVASEAVEQETYRADAPWGGFASYLCAYDRHTEDPQGLAIEARALPQYVGLQPGHWVQWCAGWKVPDISETLSAEVVSDVPTLIFRGDLSPDGNPQWIFKIERGLSKVQTLVFPALGGDLLLNGPPCLSALRRQFLANPHAALATAACEVQPPIPFVAQ
jgi:class 3 adenylate cyclase/pimeloyl-ACP methyl ester carboxylesterase